MQAVNIIVTSLIVTTMAMGGAYIGAFSQVTSSDDGSTTITVPLNRTVELLPISIPMYSGADRIGYCLMKARAELSTNFSDDEYQLATAQSSDVVIRALSNVPAGLEAETACTRWLNQPAGPAIISEADYYELLRAIPMDG